MDYAKLDPKFWISPMGRRIKKDCPEATIVALYLIANPHANMLGLYYLPMAYLAHETGLPLEGALKGLQRVVEAGFCDHDPVTETVWVHGMAAWQVGEVLKPKDNRVYGIRKMYESLPDNPYLSAFYDRYAEAFHLDFRRETPSETDALADVLTGASEGALKGLRSPSEANSSNSNSSNNSNKDSLSRCRISQEESQTGAVVSLKAVA